MSSALEDRGPSWRKDLVTSMKRLRHPSTCILRGMKKEAEVYYFFHSLLDLSEGLHFLVISVYLNYNTEKINYWISTSQKKKTEKKALIHISMLETNKRTMTSRNIYYGVYKVLKNYRLLRWQITREVDLIITFSDTGTTATILLMSRLRIPYIPYNSFNILEDPIFISGSELKQT